MYEMINISFVGIDGLIDRIVIETAEQARIHINRWKKAVKKNEHEKIINNAIEIWDCLKFFLDGSLDYYYPDEHIDGRKFYEPLLMEWKEVQEEVGRREEIPAHILKLGGDCNGY